MEDEFRLTSREYATIRGLSVEALRSRRRRELERGNFVIRDGKYFWKNDRPIKGAVIENSHPKRNGLFRDPGAKKIDTRKRNRGSMSDGTAKDFPNYKMKIANEVKILARIRNELGDEYVDEIGPEMIELAKKKVAEKKQKKADKELKKAEARNPSVQVPIGLDRTPLEYGQQLNAKQLHNVKYEKNRKNLEQWKRDTETKFIEKRYTDFFGQERHKPVVDFSSSNRVNRRPPYYVGEWIEPGSVEVEPSHESVLSSEPVFRNKIEEDIWRLKNKK